MPSRDYYYDNRIKLYGTTREILKAEKVLNGIPIKDEPEDKARLILQEYIDLFNLKVDILLKGNSIVNKKRILTNVKRLIKTKDMTTLSDYFYKFLYGHCGSIAHYNKYGWVCKYPRVIDLKNFFYKNEFGCRVYDWIPIGRTDAKAVVLEIEELFDRYKQMWKVSFINEELVAEKRVEARFEDEAKEKAEERLTLDEKLNYKKIIVLEQF